MPDEIDIITSNASGKATIMLETVIEFAAEQIAYCVRESKLKRDLAVLLWGEDQYGELNRHLTTEQFSNIKRRAYKLLKVRADASSEVARQESIGFYESIISDEKTPWNVKIKARENLDKINKVVENEAQIVHQTVDVNTLGLTMEERKQLLNELRSGKNKGQ